MNKEFDYKTNLFYRANVTVIAKDKEEADRILNDTLNSVEDKFKNLFTGIENVEVKSSKYEKQFYSLDKNREAER